MDPSEKGPQMVQTEPNWLEKTAQNTAPFYTANNQLPPVRKGSINFSMKRCLPAALISTVVGGE